MKRLPQVTLIAALLFMCSSALGEQTENFPRSEWWNVAVDSDVLSIHYKRGDDLLFKTKTDGTVCFDTKKGEVKWSSKTLDAYEPFTTDRTLVSVEKTTDKVSFYSWETGELQFSFCVPHPANESFYNGLNPTQIFENDVIFSFCCYRYICIVNKKDKTFKTIDNNWMVAVADGIAVELYISFFGEALNKIYDFNNDKPLSSYRLVRLSENRNYLFGFKNRYFLCSEFTVVIYGEGFPSTQTRHRIRVFDEKLRKICEDKLDARGIEYFDDKLYFGKNCYCFKTNKFIKASTNNYVFRHKYDNDIIIFSDPFAENYDDDFHIVNSRDNKVLYSFRLFSNFALRVKGSVCFMEPWNVRDSHLGFYIVGNGKQWVDHMNKVLRNRAEAK